MNRNASLLVPSPLLQLPGTHHRLLASLAAFFLWFASSLPLLASGIPPKINEFMASNSSAFENALGNSPDWIEIHNPNSTALNIGGYFLTDDPDNLQKWRFPMVQIPANGYLLVMASSPENDQGTSISDFVDSDGRPHATFRLNAGGEYLALVSPDGTQVLQEFAPEFPKQITDVSYGFENDGQKPVYFERSTPGEPNGTGYAGIVEDTNFSVDRGFFDAPFTVVISSDTPDATIYYTLDSSEPGPGGGSIYQGPITIQRSTVLRARAFRDGRLPTNVDTQTYLFIEDILRQPPDPPGSPSDWGTDGEVPGVVVADYEMDPRVVEGAEPGYTVREALLDIPSLSVVMEPQDFLGRNTGIYNHPKKRGDSWERLCSMELIHPDGTPGFQVNAQIEIHGNSSRRPWRMQKHSFRVSFLSKLGPARLEYPLFAESPVKSFDELVLRACFTDSWGLVSWAPSRYRPNDSQYIRDVWMKESLRDMGQPSSYGTFVHLYINGLYWGLYNFTERIEAEFFANHFGGDEEGWSVIQDFENTSPAWNQMFDIARTDPSSTLTFHNIQRFLDLTNFADYMLLHFYADAEDWPHQNGYAASRQGEPFRFFVWDQEIVLDNHRMRRYDVSPSGTPGELFQLLRQNPEFRMLFADRVQKHLFHGGALSLRSSRQRYLQIANSIDKAIVAESARWGDTQISTPYGSSIEQPSDPNNRDDRNYPTAPHGPAYYFTREDSWLVERDNVLNHYLPEIFNPANPNSLLRELRSENLFPQIEAPSFNQHEGSVGAGFLLQMAAPEGTIYFTLDGTDPRQAGSASEPFLLLPEFSSAKAWIPEDATDETQWFQIDYDDQNWTAGLSAVGYETASDNFQHLIQLDVSEMHRHVASVYVRMPFEVTQNQRDRISRLILQMQYDDGFAAYFNGIPVAAVNAPSPLSWNSAATQEGPDSAGLQFSAFEISDAAEHLIPGKNVLAIHGLNLDARSSDLLIHPRLEAYPDPSLEKGLQALQYSEPVPLTNSVTVKARAYDGEEWSALSEANFVVSPPDPNAGFTGDPHADRDQDGMPALLEYALDTSDTDVSSGSNLFKWEIRAATDPSQRGTFVYFSFPRHTQRREVILTLQTSTDLVQWSDETYLIFLEEQTVSQNLVRVVYRSLHPLQRLPKLFIRLKAEL